MACAQPAAGALRMAFPDDPAWPQRPAGQFDAGRERDRIHAELQDQVIHAIFAVGLHLNSAAAGTADPLVRRQVEKAISDLEDIIRIIRDTAFDLSHRFTDRGLRAGTVHPCEHPQSPAPPSTGR